MTSNRSMRALVLAHSFLAILASTACSSEESSAGAGGAAGATGGSAGTSAGGATGGSAGTAAGGDAGAVSGGSAGAGGDAGSGPGDASAPDADGPDGGWPATGPCFGVPVVELGTIQLDGVQHLSSGFSGSNILIAQFVAPASGSSYVTIYEYATPTTWKKAWLSEHRCDMTATGGGAFSQGIGPNLHFAATTTGDAGAFNFPVTPGKTYYVMVKNELMGGQPSCGTGQICDVALKIYPPG